MSLSDSGEIDIKTDVLIVGGGMVGLATAIALGGAGLEVLLVDAEPAAEREGAAYDGRSSAIAYGSRQALAMLGIWPGVAPEAEPILDIRVSDGRPANPQHPFSCITIIATRASTPPSATSWRTGRSVGRLRPASPHYPR